MTQNKQITGPTPLPSFEPDDLPFHALRADALCPACGKGILDYNGLLKLECPHCSYNLSCGGSWT
jgi:uncharacterized protein (DUF983 family)